MKIINRKLDTIKPYERNPRRNDDAVPLVANSIRRFGFKVPIVIDKDGVIVTGHTRFKAAKSIGMSTVPCIIADDLTPAQIKAFRLADNKVAEVSEWDEELLAMELLDLQDEELFETDSIELLEFGFDEEEPKDGAEWFEGRERFDESDQEGNGEYNEFLDKFEIKKTTDDCYTPDGIYDAVADWVAEEYGVDRKNFVRPFYPNGDYQSVKYKKRDIVVDNPPFSILSEIVRWYDEHGVRFFLFAPALTLFSSSSSDCACAIGVGYSITYENKANVSTSFLTNLETARFRTAPDLWKKMDEAMKEILAERKVGLTKNEYPDHVMMSTMLSRYSKYGIEMSIPREESMIVRELDEQKEKGKVMYGGGFLLSERAAAERAAAERAAAERAAAERWALSDREWAIVKELSENGRENKEATEVKTE